MFVLSRTGLYVRVAFPTLSSSFILSNLESSKHFGQLDLSDNEAVNPHTPGSYSISSSSNSSSSSSSSSSSVVIVVVAVVEITAVIVEVA